VPAVLAFQDRARRDRLRLRLAQLPGPLHPAVGRRAGAGAAELAVAGGLLPVRLVPVVPALRPDVRPHVAVQEEYLRKVAPRAAEVDALRAEVGGGRQATAEEHVAEGGVLRRRGGSQVALALAVD